MLAVPAFHQPPFRVNAGLRAPENGAKQSLDIDRNFWQSVAIYLNLWQSVAIDGNL